jgi:hypothetical protein
MDEIDEWGGKRLHASLRLTSCSTSTSTIMPICMFGGHVAARAIKTPTGPPTCIHFHGSLRVTKTCRPSASYLPSRHADLCSGRYSRFPGGRFTQP